MKSHVVVALVVYFAAIVRMKSRYPPETHDDTFTKVLTSLLLFLLAYTTSSRGDAPRLPEISLTVASVYAAATLMLRGQYNSIAVSFAPMVVAVIGLYAVIPQRQGWVRHLDILAMVVFGLPLIYAIPRYYTQGTKSGYSVPAADVSHAVYARTKVSKNDDVEFIHDPKTGTRCGIYVHDATIYVTFAGTDSEIDWTRTNMDVEIDEATGGHRGYVEAWKSVKERVLSALSNTILRYGGAKSMDIVACGHSLGGAVASISALDIQREFDYDGRGVEVITFGAPPIGTKKFTDTFDATIRKSTMFVVVTDKIPQLILGQLRHPKGRYVLSIVQPDPLKAHKMISYKKGLSDNQVSSSPVLQFLGMLFILSIVYRY